MNDTIRTAMRVALAEKNMTQTELAERIEASKQHVNAAIRGEVGKVPDIWQRMLDELGLELKVVRKDG